MGPLPAAALSDHNLKIESRHPLVDEKRDCKFEGWGRELARLKRKIQLTRTGAALHTKQCANADCAGKAPACLVAAKNDRKLRETLLLWVSGCTLHSEATPL